MLALPPDFEDVGRARSPGRRRKRRRKEGRHASRSSSSGSDGNGADYGFFGGMPMQPWQAQVYSFLQGFADADEDRRMVPEEFDFASPQFLLLKQLAPAKNAVVIEKNGRYWLRRISSKVARAGPFGAIRHIVKQHGGRMSIQQCASMLDYAKEAYREERLMLDMYDMLNTWHDRMMLKQCQADYKRVGIIFDKRFTWMALKGKNPGPESGSDSDREDSTGPQHVVNIKVSEQMEGKLQEALRLIRIALDEDRSRKRGSADMDNCEDVVRSVSGDGFPWWGEAPSNENPADAWRSANNGVVRRNLPAYEMRDIVNDALEEFRVVVVVGATGCGKSTQLPIAWHEHCKAKDPNSLCRVICCQPRKIAAVSLSQRVAMESGRPVGTKVGYKVRFETKASKQTEVLYCTTGVLLRAMMRNPTLEGITCIFIDEIHERDVLADFTMLLLRDIMKETRKDMKLVLMSATVDPTWCQQYFPKCHVVDLPGEQPYHVDWFWLEDCLKMTDYTPNIPVEDVLDDKEGRRLDDLLNDLPWEHRERAKTIRHVMGAAAEWIDYELIVKLVEYIERTEDLSYLDDLEDAGDTSSAVRGAILVFMPGMGEIRTLINKLKSSRYCGQWVMFPLHSTLPVADQQKVFDRPPEDKRKIIVATNIAESSVTIDDVVYVIDSGRERLLGLNPETNISSLMTQWIARSNALQRKGRAGRCRAGSYYALFSSVQFNSLFVEVHLPEMQRSQIENLCLQVKALGFADVEETLGRAPDPPDPRTLKSALQNLVTLGALREDLKLTRLGRLLMALPVHPQLGKLLLYSRLFECTDAALTIAAAMDVGRIFAMVGGGKRDDAEQQRLKLGGGLRSDHWAIVQAYRRWVKLIDKPDEQRKLADEFFISHRSLETVHKLREEFVRNLQELQGPSRQAIDRPPSVREHPEDVRNEMTLLSAALSASLHAARVTPLFDLVCLNSPPCKAAMTALSVNAKSHLVEPRLFQECFAVWFSRMKTSELFVDDCSIIPAVHVLLFGPPFLKQPQHPRFAKLQGPECGTDASEIVKRTRHQAREHRRQREEDVQGCVEQIRLRITALYEEHNPSKLGEIDGLFKKYEGIERDMYQRICSKYGVEPSPALLPLKEGDDHQKEQNYQDEASSAQRGRLHNVARHVPWVRCASSQSLDTLMQVRHATASLFEKLVGQPFGELSPASASAVRALRSTLLELGSLGDLRMESHHIFRDVVKFEQIAAPLEEPWHNERRGGSHKKKGANSGDDIEFNWKDDAEECLVEWLQQQLHDSQGHWLELDHVNENLKSELRSSGFSYLVLKVKVTREFVQQYPDMFQLVGYSGVALASWGDSAWSSHDMSYGSGWGAYGCDAWSSASSWGGGAPAAFQHYGYSPMPSPKGMGKWQPQGFPLRPHREQSWPSSHGEYGKGYKPAPSASAHKPLYSLRQQR